MTGGTWRDHEGRTWAEPTIIGRLKFRIPAHRALRAFVFTRDRFTCQACGFAPASVPSPYDGAATVGDFGGERPRMLVMDHVVSRRNGGRHHPSNLRTLCDSCNAAKSVLVDSKVRKEPLR